MASSKLSDLGDKLLLLDTCSNSPVTNQPKLFRQIIENRKSKSSTLGGEYLAPFTGHTQCFGDIDFDENLGMTVLSQHRLEIIGATVTRQGDVYLLKLPNCPVITEFIWIEDVLAGDISKLLEYYDDIDTKSACYAAWTAHDVDTPSDLLGFYKMIPELSNVQVRKLDLVHRALRTMWSPSESDLLLRLKSGALIDAEFDENDVRRYFEIFDYDLGALKGKAEDHSHDIIKSIDQYKLADDEVILYCDLFFVSGIAFLLTVDSTHKFVTTTCVKSKKSVDVMSAMKSVKEFYKATKGLVVKVFEFDKEPGVSAEDVFDTLGAILMPRSTHVSHAEVNIKVIKQRIRTMLSSIPYTPSKTMLIHIVIAAAMISNTIVRPILNGICPQESFYGTKQSMKSQFAFAPSDYVEVHCFSDNNVRHFRTVSAIPLHQTAANPREWLFYSLESGDTFIRPYDDAYLMPMGKAIIDRIKYLSIRDPINGDADLDIIGTDTSYIPKFLQPVHQPRGRPKRQVQYNFHCDTALEMNEDNETLADKFLEEYFNEPNKQAETWSPTSDDSELYITMTNDAFSGDLLEVEPRGQSVYLATSKDENFLCFASHMTSNESKRLYGEEMTVKSIEDEITGLVQKEAIQPIDQTDFNWKTKTVIPMSLFLKDKHDSTGKFIKLKARLVAGGHRQDKELYPSSRKSSPTVNIQSIFSMLSIAASEGRSAFTFDVGMAFLEAKMDEEIYMMLDKVTTSVLVKSNPEFAGLVRNGKILVQLKRALYGCIQSSKLWYDRIRTFLYSIGFTCNPVDMCIFNRTSKFDGSQCTIGLHVDDGLVTCTNNDELKLLTEQLAAEFEITVHHGPVLEYLGMKIDLSSDTCVLTMSNYIEELIKDSVVTSLAKTPAGANLFDVNDESLKLSSTRSEKVHSIVASLLYLATRTRPDILLPVVFLCSRVSISTEDDDNKLLRILAYLNATKDLPYILGKKGDPVVINCYADASFAVHKDFKSHGSILMSCGHGFVWCKCAKQKLVTKSSTEAELVTLSDAVSMSAWAIQFLKGQGYEVKANLFQDNLSTIALASNGRSTSDRTRHINIRYFFIKQYLDNGTMIVQHCPATDMIADILTKPLQGYEFIKMRNLLMGHAKDEFPLKFL